MAELVQRVRSVQTLRGSAEKELKPAEEGAVGTMQRRIVAARDLAARTPLCWDDLNWVRLGEGLRPGQEYRILGRPLKQSIQEGDPLTAELFDLSDA